jgi:hypothetical protein
MAARAAWVVAKTAAGTRFQENTGISKEGLSNVIFSFFMGVNLSVFGIAENSPRHDVCRGTECYCVRHNPDGKLKNLPAGGRLPEGRLRFW